MKITVRAFARFREVIGELNMIDLPEGSGIPVLLAELASRNDETRELLLDEQGRIREHILLMVNRKRISRSVLPDIVLAQGDEVAIYPPVAGG